MIDFQFEKLRRIGLTQYIVNALGALKTQHEGTPRLMRITQAQRDAFTLHDGEGEHLARAIPRLMHLLQAGEAQLTVGDWVIATGDATGGLWIAERIDPVTQIARRANDGRRQPLASNVDTALLVMGLDHDFNARRMERYIAMVRASDVAPVVVLTKADLVGDAASKANELKRRLPATIPVLAVNGLAASARTELAPWLAPGLTLALLGSSGAGKSTLTNTLAGAEQDTGDVRRGDGRGRHTTTARSLHLCDSGACIVDTPGLRTWRPDADGDTLAATFEDIESLALLCRFHDCRHHGEPGCAVLPRVEPDRLANYHKLLRDAQRAESTPLDRIAQRQKWKVISKAGSRRAHEKRH